MSAQQKKAFYAVIPAAGSGSRMGLGKSKLLLELAGETVLARTLRVFLDYSPLRQIIVAVPPETPDVFKELCERTFGEQFERLVFVSGAETRQGSVRNCLDYLQRQSDCDLDASYVAVHDGARCLIDRGSIELAFQAAERYQAITLAVPVIDTITRVAQNGEIVSTLDRSELWAKQTPQVFNLAVLCRAHRLAGPTEVTDDAALVEAIQKVRVVEGPRDNIKITTPFDCQLAELILSKSGN